MIATEQYLRHFHPIYFFRFRVLRIFEIVHIMFHAIAFVLSAYFFLDDSRDESGDCFDHYHGWSFSAECDEVSEGNLLELFLIFFFHIFLETIIDAFISCANEDDVLYCAQTVSSLLCESIF